jgi:hypothetical protein
MTEAVMSLASCAEQIAKFSGRNLKLTVVDLEFKFTQLDKNQIKERLSADAISSDLMLAARTLKRAAAQIDVVLHALGILTLLPVILEDNETVQSLSLGAGSSEEKRFDLETNRRVAEFTFTDWQGNDSARLQKIFKDFYRLAEYQTDRLKELWLSDDAYVLKYFTSGASVRTATHKHRDLWESFRAKYPAIDRVREYYRLHANSVKVRVFP